MFRKEKNGGIRVKSEETSMHMSGCFQEETEYLPLVSGERTEVNCLSCKAYILGDVI